MRKRFLALLLFVVVAVLLVLSTASSAQASSAHAAVLASSSLPNHTLELVIEGIRYGAILAMTAVGLSLVFGTTGLINFAHGELVTIGAVIAFFFNAATSGPGLQIIPAAAIAVVLSGVLGAVLHFGLWRPLDRRKTGLIQLFIISIGLSLFLRNLVQVLFGSGSQPYADYVIQRKQRYGPIAITDRDLVLTIASLVILVLVALMLQQTRIGKAMRAVSDNRDLAAASGIDVEKVVRVVWIAGTALTGLGGIFYGLTTTVNYQMGFRLLLLIFAGIILGGLGTAYGAIVGCLVIGLVIQMSTLYFSFELQNAWALLVLVLVLIVRPQGILGRRERVG